MSSSNAQQGRDAAVIRTYKNGDDVQYTFQEPGNYVVRLADNIRKVSFVGTGTQGDTAKQITEVTVLGANVTQLGPKCFYKCDKLSAALLPSSLRVIGDNCFDGCRNVKTVAYDAYERELGAANPPSLQYVGARAFADCENLRAMTFPESISSTDLISQTAFAGSGLTSVTFLGLSASDLMGGS